MQQLLAGSSFAFISIDLSIFSASEFASESSISLAVHHNTGNTSLFTTKIFVFIWFR
jgi:hypothetical protein